MTNNVRHRRTAGVLTLVGTRPDSARTDAVNRFSNVAEDVRDISAARHAAIRASTLLERALTLLEVELNQKCQDLEKLQTELRDHQVELQDLTGHFERRISRLCDHIERLSLRHNRTVAALAALVEAVGCETDARKLLGAAIKRCG